MIIINGQTDNPDNLKLDDGFNFGRGVFETIMIKNKPILLKEHMERLKNGLKELKINNSITEDQILNIIDKKPLKDCVLKVTVTDKNIVLASRENKYKDKNYAEGFRLKLSELKRNPYSRTVYLKTLNYTDNIMEKQLADEQGFQEVLFLNTDGFIAEGAVSNIFFISGGKIYTPKVSCGILPGIMRQWVIDNFTVQQGLYTLEDIQNADEIFITNSIIGVMKICHFLNKDYVKNSKCEDIRRRYNEFSDKL